MDSVFCCNPNKFSAQNFRLDLHRLLLAGQIEMQSQLAVAGQDAIELQQHAGGGNVQAAPDQESPVFLEGDFDPRERAQLPAARNTGQARDLGVEIVALQGPINHVVASGGQTEVLMLSVVAIADEQQRDATRAIVAANLAAELRRRHIEEIEPEHDQLWLLLASL